MIRKHKNWQALKSDLLKNKRFHREYHRPDLAFEIGEMIIDARVRLSLTQAQLAKLAGTKQPSIARLERGESLPSLTFLNKLAKSMGIELIGPRFSFRGERLRLVSRS